MDEELLNSPVKVAAKEPTPVKQVCRLYGPVMEGPEGLCGPGIDEWRQTQFGFRIEGCRDVDFSMMFDIDCYMLMSLLGSVG